MKVKFLTLLIFFSYISSSIHAKESKTNLAYFKCLGGSNFLHHEKKHRIKSNFSPTNILSYSFGFENIAGINGEFEYASRKNSLKHVSFNKQDFRGSGNFRSYSYMYNTLARFSFCDQNIQPYLGAGFGYDIQKFQSKKDESNFKLKKDGFAWQLILGVLHPIGYSDFELALEYKFHKGPFHHISNHALQIGIILKFGIRDAPDRSLLIEDTYKLFRKT